MFFEQESLLVEVLNVVELHQTNKKMFNTKRKLDALSFRFRADACMKTLKKSYQVGDNSICYVPAGVDYTRIAKVDNLIAVHFRALGILTNDIECFFPKYPHNIGKLFIQLFEVWQKKDIGYQYRANALFYEILAECYSQNVGMSSHVSKIQASVEYINDNFKDSMFSIEEAASLSFMSGTYFRKLFKKEYGISPMKYVINRRIEYAASLILSGYYSLNEVAFLSGYSDYKYFSTEFKRMMGVSPSKYTYEFSEKG